jgi:prophage DNA circulation protein
MRITDLATNSDGSIRSAWRAALMPAHFDGNPFHVDSNAKESGQRVVVHEFPKRDFPYAESMGRKAIEFTVRGYCICYPSDVVDPLYMRDYRRARDLLQNRLDAGGPGVLQLPTFTFPTSPMTVVCQRYRLTEEDRFGGYCTFDMSFVELGVQPGAAPASTQDALSQKSMALKDQIERALTDDASRRIALGNIPLRIQ